MTRKRDYARLDAEDLKNIRADLDKQSPAQRKAAEKAARAQVKKAARNPDEERSFLAKIFGGK